MSRKKKKKSPQVEHTYLTTITYQCPVRGTVSEEIEVKRYQSLDSCDPDNVIRLDEYLQTYGEH